MKPRTVFVAGTDTGVGKTHVTAQLLQAAHQHGLRTAGLKPVAAGAQHTPQGWRNEDALALQAAASVALPYDTINPWCFPDPVAPHLAAQRVAVSLAARQVAGHLQHTVAGLDADLVLVEGAGGWRVPLNATETLADVVKCLQWPVVLVVGMKLGCLNHALLTAEAIRADGLSLLAWVANDLGQPMEALQDNIRALEDRLTAPRLDVARPVAALLRETG